MARINWIKVRLTLSSVNTNPCSSTSTVWSSSSLQHPLGSLAFSSIACSMGGPSLGLLSACSFLQEISYVSGISNIPGIWPDHLWAPWRESNFAMYYLISVALWNFGASLLPWSPHPATLSSFMTEKAAPHGWYHALLLTKDDFLPPLKVAVAFEHMLGWIWGNTFLIGTAWVAFLAVSLGLGTLCSSEIISNVATHWNFWWVRSYS